MDVYGRQTIADRTTAAAKLSIREQKIAVNSKCY